MGIFMGITMGIIGSPGCARADEEEHEGEGAMLVAHHRDHRDADGRHLADGEFTSPTPRIACMRKFLEQTHCDSCRTPSPARAVAHPARLRKTTGDTCTMSLCLCRLHACGFVCRRRPAVRLRFATPAGALDCTTARRAVVCQLVSVQRHSTDTPSAWPKLTRLGEEHGEEQHTTMLDWPRGASTYSSTRAPTSAYTPASYSSRICGRT